MQDTSKLKSRKEIIAHVLNDLYSLKHDNFSPNQQYAIDENILFFQAARSIFGYLIWLFRIGFAKKPGVKSLRLPPNIEWL